MGIVFWLRVQPLALAGLEPLVEDAVHKWAVNHVMSRPNQKPPRSAVEHKAMVDRWMADNPDKLATYKKNLLDKSRNALTVQAQDGTRYPYLGDVDSYHWLRAARNYVQSGSACDEVVDGICRDTRTLAPVGGRMIDGGSLHIRAIVLATALVKKIAPSAPLMYAAMMVPIIVGVIGVIPAFAIGWRLAGTFGGFASALVISANTHFLSRSAGADSDVWNVVLPLFLVWLVIEALITPSRIRCLALGTCAAVVAGIHGAIWSGWTLGVAAVLSGLIAALVLEGTRSFLASGAARSNARQAIGTTGLVAAIFLGVILLLAVLMGKAASILSLPVEIFRTIGISLFSSNAAPSAVLPWPDIFGSVAELTPQTRKLMTEKLGWELILGGAVGLFLVVLPRRGLNLWHFILVGWIAIFIAFLFLNPGSSRLWLVIAIALPPVMVMILEIRDSPPSPAGHAPELIVIFWLLATLYLAHQGGRFVMLLVPPLGIVFGCAAGRLFELLQQSAGRSPGWRLPGKVGGVVLIALMVAPSTYAGWNVSHRFIPGMDDAWWDSFSRIRAASAKNAIVTTWWDHGHWAKYVTDRRVTTDGATLLTHVHHWLGRALTTADSRESRGILRMLNCGSDATPNPEGSQGAFGRLVATGMSDLLAYKTLRDLVVRSKSESEILLRKAGLSESERRSVLMATHCRPPASFLVLSSKVLIDGQAGWLRIGSWDYQNPRRQQPLQLTHHTSPYWHRCNPVGGGLVCPLRLVRPESDVILERFEFPVAAPQKGRAILRDRKTGKLSSRPAQVIVVTDKGFVELPVMPGAPKDLAILLDPVNRVAFVGSKPFLLSTFARLALMRGRHAPGFRRLYERRSVYGEIITTWRVQFPAER